MAKICKGLERNASTNSCKPLFQRKKIVFKLEKVRIFAKNCHKYLREIILYLFVYSISFQVFNLFRQFSSTFRLLGLEFVGKN
jgi:hypothetical protein